MQPPLCDEQQQQQPLLVNCWACRTLIQVPFDSQCQQPAELFKCGWCGAINSLQQHWDSDHAAAPSSWVPLALQRVLPPLRWLSVACVLLLVGSLGGLGVAHLLPLVCTSTATYGPNLALALVLMWCVLGHYCVAVRLHPGAVAAFYPEHAAAFAAGGSSSSRNGAGGAGSVDGADGGAAPVGSSGYVAAGSFDCWAWCRRCCRPKPPRTHHCRRCRICVVGLDHHCIMLANCVGDGNMRPFLLFLLWALAAACYTLCMVAILVAARRHEIAAALAATRSAHRPDAGSLQGSSTAGPQQPQRQHPASASPGLWLLGGPMVFFLLAAAPLWVLEAMYLVSVSVGVLLALGMLLASQLHYLGLGESYVDALQHEQQQQQPGVGPPPVGRLAGVCRAVQRLGAVLLPQDGGGGGWRAVAAALLWPGWRCSGQFYAAAGGKSKAT